MNAASKAFEQVRKLTLEYFSLMNEIELAEHDLRWAAMAAATAKADLFDRKNDFKGQVAAVEQSRREAEVTFEEVRPHLEHAQ